MVRIGIELDGGFAVVINNTNVQLNVYEHPQKLFTWSWYKNHWYLSSFTRKDSRTLVADDKSSELEKIMHKKYKTEVRRLRLQQFYVLDNDYLTINGIIWKK